MRVVWARAALGDVERIYRYFLPLNLGAARRIAEEVFLAGDSLAHFPNRGRPGLLPGTRELVAAKPYVLIYRVSESEVRVLRV